MSEEKKDDAVQAPPQRVEMSLDQFNELMSRLNKLENQPAQTTMSQGNTLGAQGQVQGIVEKFSVDPAHYLDPCKQLFKIFETDPKLRRFGLQSNYDLKWSVNSTKYQTAFGTWYIEPRFELTVYRKRFDEDGNERSDKIILNRASFFQDPAADLQEAELAGLDYTSMDPSDFASEMRIFRYTQFVLETLQPNRLTSTKPQKKMEVIGGKAYEVEEGANIV